jgi:shikimate kinase
MLTLRVGDFSDRGIASCRDQTFESLFAERRPLYQRYADVTVHCTQTNVEETVKEVLTAVT